MRSPAVYLCLMLFTLCLVVPCGCSNQDDLASDGPNGTQTARKKADKTGAKKNTAKNAGTAKKGDTAKGGAQKKSVEPVVLVDVPERTVEQIMGFYSKKFTLSEDQEKEAEQIIMAHGAEFRELRQRAAELLTKEMREARSEATKKALEGGASKSDAAKAGKATIDAATSAKLDVIDNEESELIKKIRLEVRKILNDEQREILKEAAKSSKESAGKKDAEKESADKTE